MKINRINILSLSLVLSFSITSLVMAQDEIPSPDQQIKAAVSAAPENLRQGAKVLGYNQNGELVTLREGSNELICLASDPNRTNFHVSCYYKELEPFMKVGRELRAQGKSHEEVDRIREEDIESGKLEIPTKPMALYNLTGPKNGFDYSTGKVMDASPLYVVYIPYATENSTGLSTSPASPGAPWIMEPGTPWAHIMVMPPKQDQKQN